MDMTGFKSWLKRFHELNKDIYDTQRGDYFASAVDPCNPFDKIIGFQQMWDVIYNSHRDNVVIAVIDELIRMAHRQRCRPIDSNNSHLPMSVGFASLFHRFAKDFHEYIATNCEPTETDFKITRNALVLRRILEYSIGKKWKREKGKSEHKYAVFYTVRNKRDRRHFNLRRDSKNQTRTMEVFGYLNSRVTDIRDKLVNELHYKGNPRQIVLFRRHKDRFVMIEEHSLPYLSFCDLANKKKIELEVEIIAPRHLYFYQRKYMSISRHFAFNYEENKGFWVLQELLFADSETIALSAYYILKYLPPNHCFMYDCIH